VVVTRVVVHIRRLSVHGAGSFSAERFQARLAAELEQRLGGGAAIAAEPRNQEHRAASSVAARIGAAAPELHEPGAKAGTRSP